MSGASRVRRSALAAALWLAWSASVVAVEPGEMLEDPALEARARTLSAGLRCLVCQNQSIDESDAPLAKDLRILIRERIAAGDSDAEVTDFVVERYGTYVLLRPPLEPSTLLLWGGPFALLVAGAGFLLLRSRAASRSPAEAQLGLVERAALDRLARGEPETPLANSPDRR
jgi:cytochrome c-type biogenesis protein CcmH